MRVLLVTTWDIPCGIAEMAFYLKEAVEQANPSIQIAPDADALDPQHDSIRSLIHDPYHGVDVLHLNYQAALHSRWTPDRIKQVRENGVKVLVTYHDSGVPNSDQCKAICTYADYFVIHEPYEDLPPHGEYLRMGVPEPQSPIVQNHAISQKAFDERWMDNWSQGRPILGSVGFPFGHKCFPELARWTGKAGWALLLIAPTATADQIAEWRTLNPYLHVRTDFVRRREVISLLSGCDATAFMFVCHNTGQSGSVLQGIAARKPVIALRTCRMFRSLYLDPLGAEVLWWPDTFEQFEKILHRLPIQRVDPGIVALAQQDAWENVGRRYAQIYKDLCTH